MPNLRHALRWLFKTPFVTVVAIVSLALGIGANAAIFSLFDQFLLAPLPIRHPEGLVNLTAPGPKPGMSSCGQAGDCDQVFSYPMFRDLQRVQTVFSDLAGHRGFPANIGYQGQVLSGAVHLVSGSYFPALGLQPALGRLLGPDDDRTAGGQPVAVLSHAYWTTKLGGRPDVLNQTLILNGHPLTIVGIAPRGFEGTTLGSRPEAFAPLSMFEVLIPGPPKQFENRRAYWIYTFARLKPGVSIDQAKAALNGQYRAIVNDVELPLQQEMSDQRKALFKTKEVLIAAGEQGQSSARREVRGPLLLLFVTTGIVLLIACANIANLLLARAASRASEMAVRLSIGASRMQLLAQLMTESLILAVCGGALSLVVAYWTLNLITSLLPAEATAALQLRLQPAVVWFTAALSIGTGLLFGIFPALHSTRADLVSALKSQSGQPSGARGAARFRTALITVQIALSMALLISAGLFVKSLSNVSRVDLGLKIDHVITFGVSPELNGYEPTRSRELFERAEAELAAVPGVTAVTAARVPLLAGDTWNVGVGVQGFKAGPDTDRDSNYNEVGPGYFRTFGIPILSGREFTPADAIGSAKVVIVNQAFVEKFNLGRDAVGKHVTEDDDRPPDLEIVGVVQNTKYATVKRPNHPLLVLPYRQNEKLGSMVFYVRTALDPESVMQTAAQVIAKLDPNLPVENMKTLPQVVRDNVFLDRLISMLAGAFAVLATLLAAIGLYGVLAYTVSQRTREFGLRMALGADSGNVRGLVLRQVGWLTLIGGAIGIAAAVALGRAASSLLFELEGYDPLVIVTASVLLTVVALGAGLVPAHRASRVEPMTALRYE